MRCGMVVKNDSCSGGSMSFQDILKDIHEDLAYVEEELQQYATFSKTVLGESSRRLVLAGGKRLRPAFVLLSGKFFNYDLERVGQLAVAIELIHMATLVHDDVIDGASLRRGLPTVRAEWGDPLALYTGDYLFARALAIISRYGNEQISRLLAAIGLRMCEGEIEQIATAGRIDLRVVEYLRRIKRKTALLFSACCWIGGIACGATAEEAGHLKKYGYYLGMAFQITDDLLDFVSSEQRCGKPVTSDLKQGIVTLPVIYALRDRRSGAKLKEILMKEDKQNSDWEEAFNLIRLSGALGTSWRLCDRYLQKARKELFYLPDLLPRRVMEAITDFIGLREY
ncbi:heptaprenyl diphosphate synthase component 2 [Thermacetogenium phaeum DSM 12270]|uniref:Heptaprenyl diphosphate synthase component 2 n=3 Tax=Thermacetogenium phaeum TaxID=85874 RepID=K4LUP9_THEPS|nr:heptaprenyl diphosphate synthase component 2 [Thermacetogenium phaeum DSM 12270]